MDYEVEFVAMDEIELTEEQEKELGNFLQNGSRGTKYNYTYVPLEYVIKEPEEYIIPECISACKALWNKNIETLMVSNYDDIELYVLIMNLSKENEMIIKRLVEEDPRYFYDSNREAYGIKVNGMSKGNSFELLTLTDVFKMQDTSRYVSEEEFLNEYKKTDGEYYVEDGFIKQKENPMLVNITFEEALNNTKTNDLYVEYEGRIYENELFLSWHINYLNYKNSVVKNKLDIMLENNADSSISQERDNFLDSNFDYLINMLNDNKNREYIRNLNKFSGEALFEAARNLMDEVEFGDYCEEDLEVLKNEIILYLAAIQDKTLVKEIDKNNDLTKKVSL